MASWVDGVMRNFAPAVNGEASVPWGAMFGTRNFELFVTWARNLDSDFADAVDPGPEDPAWDVDTAKTQIDDYYNT